MGELIYKDEAITAISGLMKRGCMGVLQDARIAIQAMVPVDAVPVVHGRWKGYNVPHWTKRYDDNGDPEYKYYAEYVCSICRRRTIIKENYCPNCGAKM